MDSIQILGIVSGTLTTLAFFPQAYKIIKTKQTKDISLLMYSILITGISLWIVYGFMRQDLPVILANCITLIPSGVILGMKIKNRKTDKTE